MAHWVDVELDSETLALGEQSGFFRRVEGVPYLTTKGEVHLRNWMEGLPTCPKCEQKSVLLAGDYLCAECRYGDPELHLSYPNSRK